MTTPAITSPRRLLAYEWPCWNECPGCRRDTLMREPNGEPFGHYAEAEDLHYCTEECWRTHSPRATPCAWCGAIVDTDDMFWHQLYPERTGYATEDCSPADAVNVCADCAGDDDEPV